MTGSVDAIFLFPVGAIALLQPEIIQLGDFGFTVQRLQESLICLGFYDGSIDGYFSDETETSLRQAQWHFRLKVTGKCDAQTWQVLKSMMQDQNSAD